ncbi:MAG: single-stranded-DNA-specific exonuclease RecJ [Burkholderiaceae bacterium]
MSGLDGGVPPRPPELHRRRFDASIAARLQAAGLHPVLARVASARGITDAAALNPALADLLRPERMHGLAAAAALVADAVTAGAPIVVVGDYDCDGATASALAVSGLRRLGALTDYLVPNRFIHGYGLSEPLVDIALAHPRLGKASLLITVDNGIASIAGVRAARAAGLKVVITDHHLPGDALPKADAIVDPNLPQCGFPSRHLAGVGVAFYLLSAVRAELVARARFEAPGPPLGDLLDLVALGTIADVVPLDENNRRLVHAGLQRIRSGRARPGIQALLRVAGCAQDRVSARDLGFLLGPRINAAGRLDDITLGIECLLADSLDAALPLAERLDAINRERRDAQLEMQEQALAHVGEPGIGQRAIVAFDPHWHQGIVGLVAGRLRERHHRPAFAFAPDANSGLWRGSGRSIPDVHLRDILAWIDTRRPGLIERFGGHAMAAGLSLQESALRPFADVLEQALHECCDDEPFSPRLLTDGELTEDQCTLDLALLLERQIWGSGFPAPLFANEFQVQRQRVVGNGHLQLELALDRQRLSAIFFGRDQPLPARCMLAYRLQANSFRGSTRLQLLIEAAVGI